MSTQAKKKDLHYLHVVIVLALMFLFRFLPAPAPITPYGMQVIGIFLGMLYGWCLTNNLIWPSLLAFAAMATTDFGSGMDVMVGLFNNQSVVMIVFGSFLMGPLAASGAGDYLVYKMLTLKMVAGKPWRITLMLVVGLYVLSLVVTNQMLIMLLILSLLPSTLKACGYTPQDKYPNMLIMGIACAMLLSCMAYPFMNVSLMPIGTLYASTGLAMDNAKWMIVMIGGSILFLLGFVMMMKLMRCDASKMVNISGGELEERFKNGIDSYQKAILVATAVLLIGCVVVSFFGGTEGIRAFFTKFGTYGLFLLVPAVMMFIKVDEKPLLTSKMILDYFPWDLFFCLTAAMFVAGQLTAQTTGVSAAAGMLLGSLYSGIGEYWFFLIIGILCYFLTNFLNNIAMMMVFLSVLYGLFAQGLLADVYTATLMVTFFSVLGFWAPSGSVQAAMAHSFEMQDPKTYYKLGVPILLYGFVFLAVFFLPFSMFIF